MIESQSIQQLLKRVFSSVIESGRNQSLDRGRHGLLRDSGCPWVEDYTSLEAHGEPNERQVLVSDDGLFSLCPLAYKSQLALVAAGLTYWSPLERPVLYQRLQSWAFIRTSPRIARFSFLRTHVHSLFQIKGLPEVCKASKHNGLFANW